MTASGTCPECKAVYLPGIVTCPACARPLEGAEPPEPEGPFVPVLTAPYARTIVARATLEAAGIETREEARNDLAAYEPDPVSMTLLVRQNDLAAARKVLRLS